MSDHMNLTATSFTTAVLFLVFNRLDTTQQVFSQIRRARPPRIYLASDGPRRDRPNEHQEVVAIRDFLLHSIDWPCEVYTRFNENNLGCALSVSNAITWFFQHEEQGIILEDDCLPSLSFFRFCEELLIRYQTDLRIWHISGFSLNNGEGLNQSSYYYAKSPNVWGWATWRNRWQKFDLYLERLEEFNRETYWREIFPQSQFRLWHQHTLTTLKLQLHGWDYQWYFCLLINHGMAIVPKISLIRNIGFGNAKAVNFTYEDTVIDAIQANEIPFPLVAPAFMCIDAALELPRYLRITKSFSYKNRVIRFFYIKLDKIDKVLFNGILFKLYRHAKYFGKKL